MKIPGFTAEASVNLRTARYLTLGVDPFSSARVTPQLLKAINAFPRPLLCALAWEDCRWNGICEWYFANCLESNGGGGGDGGGVSWPPRPNHNA